LKFDEFALKKVEAYWPYSAVDVSKRIERFAKKAKTSKSSRFYVITYSGRQYTESSKRELSNWAAQAKSSVQYSGTPNVSVNLIDGGFPDADMLEFWIGGPGSEPPRPTPTYSASEAFECPEIRVVEDGTNFDPSYAGFTVRSNKNQTLRPIWSSSYGEIVSGNSYPGVHIDAKGEKRLTVYAEITGLPKGCQNVFYDTFDVGLRPLLVDRDDAYLSSELAARFQVFVINANNEPAMTPYILAYSSRGNDQVEQNRAINSIRQISTFLQIDTSRIKS
jgi:hypothetical protein